MLSGDSWRYKSIKEQVDFALGCADKTPGCPWVLDLRERPAAGCRSALGVDIVAFVGYNSRSE